MDGTATPFDQKKAIDTIRVLSIDAIQAANSGHPGAPMGAAPMTYALWTGFLKHAPTHPDWLDRDRFVLSAGHASMLLYSMLHLTGYDLSLDELKRFRQMGSRTPGHPEFGLTAGVEATTGPLGQGFTNAVGMAIAERRLAAEFNKPGHELIDHYTYTICSDGDLQEGITSEAASLAGHLGLGKLIALYDDNDIQLDGPTSMAWSEDVLARFEAYGWHTQRVEDGEDVAAISAAIEAARADARPSIISVKTIIGAGSPNKAGTHKVHGAPLGAEEVAATKVALGFDPEASFEIDAAVLSHYRDAAENGERLVAEWEGRLTAYAEAYPEAGAELRRRIAGVLAEGWDTDLPWYSAEDDGIATRNASNNAINGLKDGVPELIGGSADLSGSNLTDIGRRRGLQRRRERPQHPLRRARARHGRHRQRHRLSRRPAALRGHLPALQRLHARLRAPGLALRLAGHLRLDARLHRCRRGRPHAPVGGALRRPARHPQPDLHPARRSQRGVGGLGPGGRAPWRARWPWPSRARSCRCCRARPSWHVPASARGPMYWPRP